MPPGGQQVIFHIDMDAFFASIEQRDNASYRGKPLVVGALPGTRGVVSAASYEARRFGIHSAMPINEAYRRCPSGIFVNPRMKHYQGVSHDLMQLLLSFSPDIEQISVDEAFLDMTGTERLYGKPFNAARKIVVRIQQHLQLSASIGIAPNKFLAKLASDMQKPAGITITPWEPEAIVGWLAPLAVGKIWGVGVKSRTQLSAMGIETIGDLQQLSRDLLWKRFGKAGVSLYDLCRGIDKRSVSDEERVKSISREHTFNSDSRDPSEWKKTLLALSHDVARRARKHGVKGKTIVLSFRRPDFSRHSRQLTLPQSTDSGAYIYEKITFLLSHLRETSLRLIGVGVTNLEDIVQTSLFANNTNIEAWEASERAVDKIAHRFGNGTIDVGTSIKTKKDA